MQHGIGGRNAFRGVGVQHFVHEVRGIVDDARERLFPVVQKGA